MASDVNLVIFDPQMGAIVCDAWIGMSDTIAKARSVLRRDPDHAIGFECWARLQLDEILEISATHYLEGAGPDEIQELAARFPPDGAWWMLFHDY
ncbi:MAG TPA: hypothetical protein P5081_14090 [Phycisphaerae bacterium]|nr:hypothetical protein [Phycisphaerae bacterium]HRW54001.1 hypothetical protein [Phycisphaerae bacterium]